MATLTNIECLVDDRFGVGESPLWDEARNRLWWSDNETDEVHTIDLATRARSVRHFGKPIGSLGLARSGRLVVAAGDSVFLFDPERDRVETLAVIPLPPKVMKLNDGKVGSDGTFWVGSMSVREPVRPSVAQLYRVGTDGAVEVKIETGIRVSNGLAWSPDGRRMYHSDSQGLWIDTYDFDPTSGSIANRRRFRELTREEGFPDGAATDAEGAYWSGGFSAQALNRFAPDGTLLEKIPVPCAVTMPCFGGPDMKTVFFTSLSTSMVPPEVAARCPQNGAVFMARSAVAGAPVHRFAD